MYRTLQRAAKKLMIVLSLAFSTSIFAQTITTFAGGGSALGDGGYATAALISNPGGLAFDKKGNLYIACGVSNRIRKIDTFGVISTIAGTGVGGYTGDGGPATAALLNFPTGVTTDSTDNIYFCDKQNFVIRKINVVTGIISTICGNGVQGYTGDQGPANIAQLFSPENLKFDKTGNLYIAENGKHVVRKISTSGIITTIAGIGIQGYNGDGISATAAKLNYPEDIEMDGLGNIYISDEGNYRIRKISSSGIITTYGGTGGSIYGGDGMPATDAQFTPTFIKFDLMHNLYISGDRRVSKIDPSGIFHRVTGDGSATNTGDGGIALAASIYDPIGLSVDKCNNLYISLRVANKIRKIAFNPPPCNYLNVTDYIDQPAIPIFPIPTFNILNIENIITKTFYTIRNLIGANVQQGHLTQGNNTISLLQLPPGMYMLVLTDEDGKKTVKKIIKQ